jgi:succinoglycan biosynthesis protein ExoW
MITIGVVIPFYQREKGILSKALESVAAQVLPEGVRLLVVVVDDSSPLPAQDALEGFNIPAPHQLITIRQANGGPGGARNGGLDYLDPAGVDYVAFLDSDDTWSPDHIAEALKVLKGGADFYFANCGFNDVDSFSHWNYIKARHGTFGSYSPEFGELTSTEAVSAIVDECLPHASQVVYDFRRHSRVRFDASFRQACEDRLFFMDLSRECDRIVYTTRLMGQRGKGVSIYDETLAWGSPNAPNRVIEELRFRQKMMSVSYFGVAKKLRIFGSARQRADHLLFLILRNLRHNPEIAKAAIGRFVREVPMFGLFLPVSVISLPLHYLALRRQAGLS